MQDCKCAVPQANHAGLHDQSGPQGKPPAHRGKRTQPPARTHSCRTTPSCMHLGVAAVVKAATTIARHIITRRQMQRSALPPPIHTHSMPIGLLYGEGSKGSISHPVLDFDPQGTQTHSHEQVVLTRTTQCATSWHPIGNTCKEGKHIIISPG